MELLYELSYNPDFFDVIESMGKKEEIEKLLLEFQACKSPDAHLAHKYKSLDFSLSNIASSCTTIDEFVELVNSNLNKKIPLESENIYKNKIENEANKTRKYMK